MSIADIISTQSSSAANAANAAANGAKKKDQLGQDEFLKLMLAQLKNQDPMKAMDPSQFLGQLAQFSTVTGIQNMQSSITTLADSMRASQVLDGATMVGRNVLVDQSDVTLGATDSINGTIEIPSSTSVAQLNVLDSAGQLVRRIPLTTSTGLNNFTWDGTDDLGERVPAGDYSLEVVATVGGEAQSLTPLVATQVSSVTIDPNGSGLVLNTPALGSIPLAQVRRVM
ncbi:MAG: flagellar hook assembly protein FlgD [Steroidobacteraceae bacterium]